ncbi:hypothetical protein FB451DRAFT_1176047 [Mycena latifolia]|nr:hypothetical protein FB451DRAFT_1176047 [Mycena latifolia]
MSDAFRFELSIISDYVVDVLLNNIKKNDTLAPLPFSLAEWRQTVSWPLSSKIVSYRVGQGLSRLGSACILYLQKAGLVISGFESMLIQAAFVRSPVPETLLKLMALPSEHPLDANQTLGLLLYQASTASTVSPASYAAWTITSNWVEQNLGGILRQVLSKARELALARDICNPALPGISKFNEMPDSTDEFIAPFRELREFWQANEADPQENPPHDGEESEDMDISS